MSRDDAPRCSACGAPIHRHARTGVIDLDHDPLLIDPHRHRDRAAGGCMRDGVAEQVREDLMELRPLAEHERVALDGQRPVAFAVEGAAPLFDTALVIS